MQAAPRKRSLIFAIVVLAVVAVAATSGTGFAQSRKAAAGCPAPDPNNKTLNLLLIDSPSADAIKSFIPAWEKKTGIKVNVTSYDYNVAHQKELLSYKQHAGAYDVAQFDNTYIVPFGSQNLMTPLDACVKSPAYDLNDFPKALRNYGDYKGHTLGLMLSTEPMIQWYRKDIYAELGLKPAKTWAEWKQNAITIQKSGKAAGNMMGFGPNSDWWWWLLLWDNGGHLYDKNFKPSVNSPAAIKAADFLKSLLPYSTKGAISVSGDDATAKFVTEDVGCADQLLRLLQLDQGSQEEQDRRQARHRARAGRLLRRDRARRMEHRHPRRLQEPGQRLEVPRVRARQGQRAQVPQRRGGRDRAHLDHVEQGAAQEGAVPQAAQPPVDHPRRALPAAAHLPRGRQGHGRRARQHHERQVEQQECSRLVAEAAHKPARERKAVAPSEA